MIFRFTSLTERVNYHTERCVMKLRMFLMKLRKKGKI